MTYVDSFPSGFTPRGEQIQLLEKIEAAVASGYKYVVLCVPTGVGKSHVAVTAARALGSSLIITAQKILQDQYTRDFPFLYTVKGKQNFPCLDLYDPAVMTYEAALADGDVSCSLGNCTYEVPTPDGGHRRETCKFKPELKGFEVHNTGLESEHVDGQEDMCHYYLQKYRALHASHALFNYASYFQTKLYSRGMGEYLARRCIIADEAHEIEQQIIGYVGHTVRLRHLEDLNMRFADFECGTVEGAVSMMHVLADEYTREMAGMGVGRRKQMYGGRRDKLDETISAVEADPANFCVQRKQMPDSLDIKPIEVGPFAGAFFDAPVNIFMSATINLDMFCRVTGFSREKCAYIEVPLSPFPPESRAIRFHNVRKLNYRSTDEDYDAVYAEAVGIMRANPGSKGLILATSKKQCGEVAAAGGDRVIVAHEGVTGGRESALARHAASKNPNVLASPSFWFGVDLHDDLSRFQIVLKAPYPSLSDERTRIKARSDPLWYQYTALVKLLQGMGRSTRNPDDYSTTHILDQTAYDLIFRMRKFVPRAYHDVLHWEQKN